MVIVFYLIKRNMLLPSLEGLTKLKPLMRNIKNKAGGKKRFLTVPPCSAVLSVRYWKRMR